jgi:hypothetical protein
MIFILFSCRPYRFGVVGLLLHIPVKSHTHFGTMPHSKENSFLTKPDRPNRTRLVSQLENIQSDLVRLSGYVSQLSDIPNEELETRISQIN